MDALIVLSACPSEEVATEIARELVQQKLAACIHIIPSVYSIYRWQDAVEETKESVLMIKTSQVCYNALEGAIQKLHPYEIPEILAFPTTHISQDYMQWLSASCMV